MIKFPVHSTISLLLPRPTELFDEGLRYLLCSWLQMSPGAFSGISEEVQLASGDQLRKVKAQKRNSAPPDFLIMTGAPLAAAASSDNSPSPEHASISISPVDAKKR